MLAHPNPSDNNLKNKEPESTENMLLLVWTLMVNKMPTNSQLLFKTSQFDNLAPSSLLCVRLNWHWPRVQEEGKFVSVKVFRQIDRHNYR